MVVLACDLLAPSAPAIDRTVRALALAPTAHLALPEVGGRRQWLHSAWRVQAREALTAALTEGERAIHRAVAAARLEVVAVPGIMPASVADADVVDDLPPGARPG